jgi:hypothetical protein
MARIARQLLADAVAPRAEKADAVAADQVRSGDPLQHRPQLVLDRGPAVGLRGQLPDVFRRLTEGLLHDVGGADGVDRRLDHGVRKLGVSAQLPPLRLRERGQLRDLLPPVAQVRNHLFRRQHRRRVRRRRGLVTSGPARRSGPPRDAPVGGLGFRGWDLYLLGHDEVLLLPRWRLGRKVRARCGGLPAGSGRQRAAAPRLMSTRGRADLGRPRQEERCSNSRRDAMAVTQALSRPLAAGAGPLRTTSPTRETTAESAKFPRLCARLSRRAGGLVWQPGWLAWQPGWLAVQGGWLARRRGWLAGWGGWGTGQRGWWARQRGWWARQPGWLSQQPGGWRGGLDGFRGGQGGCRSAFSCGFYFRVSTNENSGRASRP